MIENGGNTMDGVTIFKKICKLLLEILGEI